MTAHGFEKLSFHVAPNGVGSISLNDPPTRNALSAAMIDELIGALERARDDAGVRCVVITSDHPTVFSSGGDLSGFAEVGLVEKHRANERFVALLRLLGEMGKPSICAANGHVLAGALGLALACDLILAAEDVRFGTPEIRVGLFPFMIMALIYRNVPRKSVAELMLLGEQIPASEAHRLGFVNRVVPRDEFDAIVADWAERLANRSPVLMKLGKDAMARQQDMGLADALDFLRSQLTIALSTADLEEGVKAFFEKRDPVWQGR
jgi:enoyl-CoA hydratase/carnithine racemase